MTDDLAPLLEELREVDQSRFTIANCHHCNKPFRVRISERVRGRGIYCSKKCADESKRGKPLPDGRRKRMSEAQKRRYSDPNERKKTSDRMKAAFSTSEQRQRLSDIRKRTLEDPVEKAKLERAGAVRWNMEGAVERHKAAMCKYAEDHPEYHERLSKLRKNIASDHEWRRNISEKLIEIYKDDDMRSRRSGENAPNWRGGKSFEPYCRKFTNELKDRIRARFDYRCFLCGCLQNGRKFPVHHIDYNKNTLCNGKIWPLIPLCNSCHSRTNYNRWYWFNLLIGYWLNNEEIHFRRFEACTYL